MKNFLGHRSFWLLIGALALFAVVFEVVASRVQSRPEGRAATASASAPSAPEPLPFEVIREDQWTVQLRAGTTKIRSTFGEDPPGDPEEVDALVACLEEKVDEAVSDDPSLIAGVTKRGVGGWFERMQRQERLKATGNQAFYGCMHAGSPRRVHDE